MREKKHDMYLEKEVKRLSLCENSLKKYYKNKIKIKILNYNEILYLSSTVHFEWWGKTMPWDEYLHYGVR